MNKWQPINTAPRDGRHVPATWAETWKQAGAHVEHEREILLSD